MTEETLDFDPGTKTVLLDLFTEIAILEHLVRFRFGPDQIAGLTPADFGVLNHFARLDLPSAKLTSLAWSFQTDLVAMRKTVDGLSARHLVELDWVDGEEVVFASTAGAARHEAAVKAMAPDVLEIVAEIDPADLQTTAATLKEIRRTFDNLPGR